MKFIPLLVAEKLADFFRGGGHQDTEELEQNNFDHKHTRKNFNLSKDEKRKIKNFFMDTLSLPYFRQRMTLNAWRGFLVDRRGSRERASGGWVQSPTLIKGPGSGTRIQGKTSNAFGHQGQDFLAGRHGADGPLARCHDGSGGVGE